ncbi:MAG: glycosyltransferase family 2 protein [Thermoanaerobaculia bacterium]
MSEPKVAAIVLNYNGRDVTLQTLASLRQMTYGNFGLIVVDNGSTDGSYQAVAEAFPDVVQVRTEKNLWAAGGANLGMRYVLERDYDYILMLNNDIEVEPAMLTELMKVAESDPSIGCVGPKAYYYWDRQRLWSAGGIIRFKESGSRERGKGEIDRGQYNRDEQVDYINGCAMLVPRRVMVEVGGWDPIYHLALEDVDWCLRMKRLGYCCVYAHRAVLWHMVSHTAGGYEARRTFQTGRSLAILVRRFGGSWQWCTFALFVAAALPLAYLRELPKRNQSAVVAKLRGVIDGLRARVTPPPKLT